MFNEIENRSIQGILEKQNVISMKDFENAYQNRTDNGMKILDDVSARQEHILVIEQEGKYWYMQSRYDAKSAAKQWAEQYKDSLTDDSVAIIFGLGDGSYVREIMALNKKMIIVIYEPCAEVFWHVFGREEIADLLNMERVFLSIQGICDGLLAVCLETFVNYANYQLVQNCIVPNYNQIFAEEYKWELDKYLYGMKRIIFNRNTEICFSKEMLQNIMKLSKDVIEQHSILQLKDILEEKGLTKMPAVLVAAGPSLDKNIDKLKEIKDSVFLMVVDTALNTVLKHGILPDMTITVDGHKPLVLFEDERVKNIPMAVSVQSNQKVIAQHNAPRFYELSPDEYLASVFCELGKAVQGLPTGGSVANNALSLISMMGFKTVIFMGLDLAYPEGQEHTLEAYHKEEKIDTQKKKYIEVEDIHGKMVLSEPNMQLYLKWFEAYIDVMPQIRFIDATEGGARIHGAELATMEQVIEEYSSMKFDKDKIWMDMPTYLTEEEQETAKKMIRDIPQELEVVEKKIKDGLSLYGKMEALNRKSNGTSERLMRQLDQVMELNDYLDKQMVFKLIKYYAILVDYQIKGKVLVYDSKSDMYTQLKGVIEDGRTLLEGYQQGIKDFRADMEHFMKQF